MRGIIICGGSVGSYIKKYLKNGDYIICADSGYDHAKKYGIKPDIIIGDMDSVKADIDGENILRFPVHKDFTDSELAIFHAKERGCREILMFGMTGTRMDHTLANISLLKYARNAVIIDKHNEIHYVDDEISLEGKTGDTVSIVPFEGKIVGVYTNGLYYKLEDGIVESGTSFGISNVMVENRCSISIRSGAAFVIKSRD